MKVFIALSTLLALASAAPQKARIVGGTPASPGQFPYQVGLMIDDGEGASWCGGSIISKDVILTAAHCTIGAVNVLVIAGSSTSALDNLPPSAVIREVVNLKDIILHPQYNDDTVENDISIVRLPSPLVYNEFIQPIALPSRADKNLDHTGDIVTIAGWGIDSDDAYDITRDLRYVERPILSTKECENYWGYLGPTNICINTEGPHSDCEGDSGGPLVQNSSKKQIGIVSFGGDSCELGIPTVYTRVDQFLDFIQQHSGIQIQ